MHNGTNNWVRTSVCDRTQIQKQAFLRNSFWDTKDAKTKQLSHFYSMLFPFFSQSYQIYEHKVLIFWNHLWSRHQQTYSAFPFPARNCKTQHSCCGAGLGLGAYHDADVVPVVERERAVHLQQIVLSFEKAFQILRVENHHQGDVVQPAQRGKRLCKQRVHRGVLLPHLNCLTGEKEQWATLSQFHQ